MEVKAGYKQTGVGVIPKDWEVKLLNQISPRQSVGLVINPSTYFDPAGSVPMLVGSNVGENSIDWDGAKTITQESNESLVASRIFAGDLVTVRVGNPGVTAVVPKEHDGSNCASMMIVRRSEKFSSPWLCYLMNSSLGMSQIENVQYGTAQKQFNISDAVNFQYPVPPFQEQVAIAEALGDVDALLSSLNKLIAKKRDIKRAAMQQLLTGQTRLPGFGGEWEVRRLGEHATLIRNSVYSRAELSTDGCVKYLHYGDIHTSGTVYLDPSAAIMPFLDVDKAVGLERLVRGDLVFVDATEDLAGVGKSVEIVGAESTELVAGLHTIAVRFDKYILADGFKAYLQFIPVFGGHLRSLAAGTKVLATNRAHIASAEVALPPIEEQIAIAKVLSDMDAELTALEGRCDKTRLLKQGMMQELLTGKTRLI